MQRLQGPGQPDPEEEKVMAKKRAQENFGLFVITVVMIRAGMSFSSNIAHYPFAVFPSARSVLLAGRVTPNSE